MYIQSNRLVRLACKVRKWNAYSGLGGLGWEYMYYLSTHMNINYFHFDENDLNIKLLPPQQWKDCMNETALLRPMNFFSKRHFKAH